MTQFIANHPIVTAVIIGYIVSALTIAYAMIFWSEVIPPDREMYLSIK